VIRLLCVLVIALPVAVIAQSTVPAPGVLPPLATTALRASLEAAKRHAMHVWRDTPAENADHTINGYIEIAPGDRRKWEFDMAANDRAIDRMIPEDIGGYPINYGFVPQTISYDGDPFDVLVLGPALTGGQLVRGVAVGLMLMEDEKGLDSKVVISPVDAGGRPTHQLTAPVRRQLEDFFRVYKRHEPGAFSRVPGFGTANEGVALVRLTHAFFLQCRERAGTTCAIDQ
jgi:inorganic pyrophosphatase